MIFRSWLAAPVLAAISVAACAYWWGQERDLWNPPSALKPDLPKTESLAPFATVHAKQADARPVFWSARRPVEKDEKKDSATNELMTARLSAVFESGGARIALLQRADGSPMKVTGNSSPWRIQSFDGRRGVFLSSDGRQVDRPLEAGSAPTAAVVPRRAPASGAPVLQGGNPSQALPTPTPAPVPSRESFRLH